MPVSQGVSNNWLKEPVKVEVVSGGGGGGSPSTDPLAPNYTSAGNTFSALNSTTTPLAAGQTFTGEWEDVSNFVAIEVLVNTDRISVTNSVWMQFSTNGTDIDLSRSVEIVVGGDFITFPTKAKFFRLLIQNGPQAQTFLRAQTQFLGSPSSLKSTPLADFVTDASAAILTKTIIEGKSSQGGGTYIPVKVSPSGALQVEATPQESTMPVSDDFQLGEILPDQTGANNVLTFTFSAPVQNIWVYAVNPVDLTQAGEVRVDPFGGTPSANLGIPVGFGGGFPIPVTTSTVRVFAPIGSRVTIYGNRRA